MREVLVLLPDLRPRGTTRQAVLLLDALRERFRTQFAALHGPGEGESARSWFAESGLPVSWIGSTNWSLLRGGRELLRLLRSSPARVIYCLVPELLPALLLLQSFAAHRPILLGTLGSPKLWEGLGAIPRRLALRRIQGVIAASEQERNRAVALGVSRDRVRIVPPCAILPTPLDGADLRRRLGLPEKARIIICVGSMEEIDSFRGSLWAFDVLKYTDPNLHLIIVGDGRATARHREFVRQLAGNDVRVHFLGERSDAASLLTAAEIVWLTNRREGGLSLIPEAFAAGVAIIAVSGAGRDEYIRAEETGLFTASAEVETLARLTRRLLADESKRQRLAAAGRRAFQERHTVAACAQVFSDAYDELIPG